MRVRIFLLLSSVVPLVSAQAAADGLIVPFSSNLPACASKCGPLFDVQGACTPPNIAATSSSCFCADPRLKPFLNSGTAGVISVCTAAVGECTSPSDQEAIQNWYASYCNEKSPNPTTTAGAATGTNTGTSTATGKSSASTGPAKPQTWFQSHWRWVVMVIVVAIGIAVIWVGAFLLRKRYIRKKEREIEMRPPVAWGPHQMQHQTGGYGDGILDASAGRSKEVGAFATRADAAGAKPKKNWLRKNQDNS